MPYIHGIRVVMRDLIGHFESLKRAFAFIILLGRIYRLCGSVCILRCVLVGARKALLANRV